MKLLAVSEHFFPRHGGTVNYVHETLSALAARGVEAELIVPGPAPAAWRPDDIGRLSYQVTWLDAGYPHQGEPSRRQRYGFVERVNAEILGRRDGGDKPDLVHVLFGLFVMERLDTGLLHRAGIPTVATVHNLPPMECARVSPAAPAFQRWKEALRLQAVAHKNNGRVRAHPYLLHVVPSPQVEGLLRNVLPAAKIVVIGHGPTSALMQQMRPPASRRPAPGAPVRLLTAAGFAPHKRQDIIPAAADALKNAGVRFHWDVVGPAGRIAGFFESVAADIRERGLEAEVALHGGVPLRDLAALYDRANLYLQPSTEEGFCITALDAATAGLAVIASPAGALPEIAAASGGRVVASRPDSLAAAVAAFVERDAWDGAAMSGGTVHDRFTWDHAAGTLCAAYRELVAGAGDG